MVRGMLGGGVRHRPPPPSRPPGVCCRVFITGGRYAGYSNRCVLSSVYYGREARRLFQQVCVVVCLLREGGTPAIPTGVCCRVFIILPFSAYLAVLVVPPLWLSELARDTEDGE